jgi:hypothetical protein
MQSYISSKTVRSGNLSIGSILLIGSLVFLTSLTRVEAAALRASPCTLAWDLCPDSLVKGYAIYYGIAGSAATNRLDAGLTNQVTIKTLYACSNYFFYAVAYNAGGTESAPSSLMYYKPRAVSSFKLIASTNGSMKVSFQMAINAACHVEYSPTLNPPNWQTLASTTADTNGNVTITDGLTGKPPTRFYRVAIP